jgi:parallel beta-helix repeat protein
VVLVRKFVISGIFVILSWASSANAHTWYVEAGSSTGNPGTETQPFHSIQKATDAAQSGDTVLVQAGTYYEQVDLSRSGITFRAYSSNAADRPVVEGGNSRSYGFVAAGELDIDDITIQGFEIRNQTATGIYAPRTSKERWTISGNLIHHAVEKGVYMGGYDHLIDGNTIHDIGNNAEAMGIMLAYAYDSTIQNNRIYMVRKEGIRDRKGGGNIIRNNIIHTVTTGVQFHEDSGSLFYNNYVYRTTLGIYPKGQHCGLGWTRVYHNTVYADFSRSIYLGGGYNTACVDIRNNIFSKAAETHVKEEDSSLNTNIIIDGNLYHRQGSWPEYFYLSSGRYLRTLSEIQSQTNYEDNGITADPELTDPDSGDLDYSESSPAAGGSLNLDSPLGRQLGARGLENNTPDFVQIPLTAIAASDNFSRAQYSTDNMFHTHWYSDEGRTTNQWITYDLGSRSSFSYIIYQPWGDDAEHNVRRYRFEVSDDNDYYREIRSGQNDDEGGWSIYEFSPPVTARYLKFHMIDKFPDDGKTWTLNQIRFAFLLVGNLVPKHTVPRLTLTFAAEPLVVEAGGTSRLTWSTENAENCAASGGWSGPKPAAGSQTESLTETTTYTLTCTGQGDTVSESVTVSVRAAAPLVTARRGSKTVDGNSSDWNQISAAPISVGNPDMPVQSPTLSDLNGVFKAAWDDTYLYILTEVSDDQYDITGGSAIYHNDGIEIMIDGLYDRSTTFGSDDHQVFVQADGVTQSNNHTPGDGAVVAAGQRTASGYVVETAIRWSFIAGKSPALGEVYGFTIDINDRDNETRESQVFWKLAVDHWKNTSEYGDLRLEEDESPRKPRSPGNLLAEISD